MNEKKILEDLTLIVRQVFDDESIMLTLSTTADDIEGWDSFNHVNIIVAAEAHFKIKFLSAEVEGLKNVGDFVEAIAHKLDLKK
jgi:acyl carrier protein